MQIITYIELSASPLKNLVLSLNLRRLKKRVALLGYSLIIYKKRDLLHFTDYRGHQQSPYSFKPFCMRLAKEAGYGHVLWLDCSMYPSAQSLEFIDAGLKRDGYFLVQDDSPSSASYYWTNDRTLHAYQVSRDHLRFRLALLAAVVGLDLKSDKGVAILDEWALAERNGLFEGCRHNRKFTESPLAEVKGHRHDQSCMELIAYKHNLTSISYNQLNAMGLIISRPPVVDPSIDLLDSPYLWDKLYRYYDYCKGLHK